MKKQRVKRKSESFCRAVDAIKKCFVRRRASLPVDLRAAVFIIATGVFWIGLAPLAGPGGEARGVREAVELIRRLWRGDRTPYDGKVFHATEAAHFTWRPVRASMPIMIGTRQETRAVVLGTMKASTIKMSIPMRCRGGAYAICCSRCRRDPAAAEAAGKRHRPHRQRQPGRQEVEGRRGQGRKRDPPPRAGPQHRQAPRPRT